MEDKGHGNGTNLLDYNTRLPPRKRLLAGMKKQVRVCDFSPPLSFNPSDIRTRLRELLNSSDSSLEEITEASKSMALAAAEVAAAARAAAWEKAAVAARAKAFARSVLELVCPASGTVVCDEESCLVRNKSKNKQVPVEIFYKSDRSLGSCDADEELARRLHQAMNSSPRISRRKHKKDGLSRKTYDSGDLVSCGRNSTSFFNGDAVSSDENSGDKAEDVVMVGSISERHEGEANCLSERRLGLKNRIAVGSKRGRLKQKKLLLSQCFIRDSKDSRTVLESKGDAFPRESKFECPERAPPPLSLQPPGGGEMSLEAESVLKCKKLKVSHFYSERKILNPLLSKPAPSATSALVKAD